MMNSKGNNNRCLYRGSHRAVRYLHTSESSINILHTTEHSESSVNALHNLQQSNSSGNILHMPGPRVHFQLDSSISDELGSIPIEVQMSINKAFEDPNNLSARTLMDLARLIMDRFVGSVTDTLTVVELCILIIQEENEEIFLESLLNMCHQRYQEQASIVKSVGSSKFKNCAFVSFLKELYSELTRTQLELKTHYEGVPARVALLSLLIKCCQDCLKPPNSQAETDTLFWILKSVGMDMERELPASLHYLLANIRDVFLTAKASPAVKKTLLHIIELHASKWQLPASAVAYYMANM